MNEEKYRDFSVEDFIADEAFIHWVLQPDREGDEFWSGFLKKYQEKKRQVGDAALIIRAIQPVEPEVPESDLEQIFLNIKKVQAAKGRETLFYATLKYAAVVAMLVAAGLLLTRLPDQDQQFPLLSVDTLALQKGRVVFSDGSFHEFEEKETVIEHGHSGNLMINHDTVRNLSRGSDYAKSSTIKVIVPYGKISRVALPDGTQIWLNSGSQLAYPGEFSSGSREVFLSGEAFFKVAEDTGNPFTVVTENMKIRVLGTAFNVSSYPEDQTAETVLVTGKVTVMRKKLFGNAMEMIPGERVIFDKPEEKFTKDIVEVEQHSSWIHEYLVFENAPVSSVFKKLERFYNRNIEFKENNLEGITFSGKLDLKDDLRAVLDIITYASTISVEEKDDGYIIAP